MVLIPSSSIKVAILSMPVSRRRSQTSGGSLGIAFPRAIRMDDRISIQMPRAVSQTRWKIKKAGRDISPPAINRPRPFHVYGCLFINRVLPNPFKDNWHYFSTNNDICQVLYLNFYNLSLNFKHESQMLPYLFVKYSLLSNN